MNANELTPITDIRNAVNLGKEYGVAFKEIRMTEYRQLQIINSDEFKLGYFNGIKPINEVVTLVQLNRYMKKIGLPKIKILEE